MLEQGVRLYSAKNLFEKNYPSVKWKSKCFKKLLLENFKSKDSELRALIIGDSTAEKHGAMGLMSIKYYSSLKVNFVKTAERPNINRIIQQIELICQNYDKFISSIQFYNRLYKDKKREKTDDKNST